MSWYLGVVFLIVAVRGQGPPPPDSGPPEQECILLLTSPIFVCDDDVSKSYMNTDKVETVMYNESLSFVAGGLEMLKPLDPATKVILTLFKKANGKKEMMLTHEVMLCDELGNEEGEFWELLKYLGFPHDCPIEPGSYAINNLVVDLSDMPINSANIGDYEAKMDFVKCEDSECKERTFECCVQLDCVIEPV